MLKPVAILRRSGTLGLAAAVAAGLAALGGESVGMASSPARQLKVAYVGELGADSPVERMAIAGLRRAVRELGVTGQVRAPGPREGFVPSFTELARQKYDLIIGFGIFEIDALGRVARAFPDVRFAILDVPHGALPHRPRNVQGIVFREQEIGYLVGYLAALMERRRQGPDVISSIGGFPIPSVQRFIAGYRAGGRKAVPRIRLLNAYAHTFTDTRRCRAVALSQVAKGSGVVFPVAGECGLGALQAVGKHDVWGIGVDADQAALGPHILTSAVKRFDVAVFRTIRALQRGRLRTGGDTVLGLRNGGLALGKISPEVPPSLVAQVERTRRQIVSGKIADIPARVG